MISKKMFNEAITSIMNLKDYNDEKYKLCKKYGADGYLVEPSNDDIILKIIKESFGNCEGIDALHTFCYEKNFGRGASKNQTYVDLDGQKHKITTIDDLYDYLVSTIKE